MRAATGEERRQSLGEEIANSVSHGVGLVAALAAAPFIIAAAARRSGPLGMVGASIFTATMVLLYLASTLYHALPSNRAKKVFRVLDHGAVYLLIAGTYTPVALGVLLGAWGWTLLGLVWTLAVVGIVLSSLTGARNARHLTVVALIMGWLVLIAIRPLWLHAPRPMFAWLVAGGLAYTVGVGCLAAKRLRYHHFAWHLFVLAGTSCHVMALLTSAR